MITSTPGLLKMKIDLRLSEDLSRRIDAWITAQPEPRPSRPDAIRRLLAEALAGEGAAVKSPALPPASAAFLRALGHREENGEGPGVRLRKVR
jgi:Arc/MetJ-type ribon-helix-helix transcriptional regulator